MALPTFYGTGTASVANGSTTVTGQGTAWQAARIRAGDKFGTPGVVPIRIASVESNTSLTLAHAWQGTALDEDAYEIDIAPANVEVALAARSLVATLAGGNLASLGGLSGTGGNKGLMLSGAGVADTFALTAFARSLTDDADAATARATLDAGRRPLTTGSSSTDWDSIVTEGWHDKVMTDSASNGPAPADYYYALVIKSSAGALTQIAVPYVNSGSIQWRTLFDATWTAWRRVLDTSTVRPRVLLTKTADQSVAHNTPAAITWSSAIENYADAWGGSGNSWISVPAGMTRVRMRCGCVFAPNANGDRQVYAELNGTTYPVGYISHRQPAPSAIGSTSFTACSPWMAATPGDYWTLYADQSSGGALDVRGANSTWWECEFA